MGLRLISNSIPHVTDMVCQRKYIALGRIVTHWREIMGEEMALRTQPSRIRHRKVKGFGGREEPPDVVLEIAVNSADSTALSYQKDLILERMNLIFGRWWISDIRFLHTPAQDPPNRPRRVTKSLTEQQKTYLSTALESVTDPEIRDRLMDFGTAMLSREAEDSIRRRQEPQDTGIIQKGTCHEGHSHHFASR